MRPKIGIRAESESVQSLPLGPPDRVYSVNLEVVPSSDARRSFFLPNGHMFQRVELLQHSGF